MKVEQVSTEPSGPWTALSGNARNLPAGVHLQHFAIAPTLEQVRHVIASMPEGTDIERRDRALMAFTLMTGARDRGPWRR